MQINEYILLEVLPIKIGDELPGKDKVWKYKADRNLELSEDDILEEMIRMIRREFILEDGIIILKDKKVYKIIWNNNKEN